MDYIDELLGCLAQLIADGYKPLGFVCVTPNKELAIAIPPSFKSTAIEKELAHIAELVKTASSVEKEVNNAKQ